MNKEEQLQIPRILLAAPASGSGKTMITCALLKALQNRGLKMQAFKCGPDYIDPMFHTQVTGCPCRNLDTYFTDENTVKYLCGNASRQADMAVLEGVMGYFDGVGGMTMQASAYDVAEVTDTPVVLIVNGKGMSLSIVPMIQGFLAYEPHKHIKGVILNRTSGMIYQRLKRQIEAELPVEVLGYFPEDQEGFAGSRYLGLKLPQEIAKIQDTIQRLALQLEKTVDLNRLIALAQEAKPLSYEPVCMEPVAEKITIGVARDEAFCFYYQDNLELLEKLGAEIVYFSPLHDTSLPKDLDGVLLGGGYPELFAEQLSKNRAMRREMLDRLQGGMPYLAECGGFLYLQEKLEDDSQQAYDMVGFLQGRAYNTGKLGRFGYISLASKKEIGNIQLKGHEFHYYDTTNPGDDYIATKPVTGKCWECMVEDGQGVAGFPHLYYYSEPAFAKRFIERCKWYHER